MEEGSQGIWKLMKCLQRSKRMGKGCLEYKLIRELLRKNKEEEKKRVGF